MKKCLHQRKAKPHWRRKQPKVMTWREKREAERAAEERRRLDNLAASSGTLALAGRVIPLGAITRRRGALDLTLPSLWP